MTTDEFLAKWRTHLCDGPLHEVLVDAMAMVEAVDRERILLHNLLADVSALINPEKYDRLVDVISEILITCDGYEGGCIQLLPKRVEHHLGHYTERPQESNQ